MADHKAQPLVKGTGWICAECDRAVSRRRATKRVPHPVWVHHAYPSKMHQYNRLYR